LSRHCQSRNQMPRHLPRHSTSHHRRELVWSYGSLWKSCKLGKFARTE
jgi:hypothetical protein